MLVLYLNNDNCGEALFRAKCNTFARKSRHARLDQPEDEPKPTSAAQNPPEGSQSDEGGQKIHGSTLPTALIHISARNGSRKIPDNTRLAPETFFKAYLRG
ncbi:hypothetical protein NPIL_88511 [Nephila pilipes]|uniref:Uncharacterized protein n=1 Tax=Nephila pilipes TaxID=299642 RepID=A0A8X6UKU0_NEPPI|nr:hypothetical protein NPIL_88511 [Nephila pilipes]